MNLSHILVDDLQFFYRVKDGQETQRVVEVLFRDARFLPRNTPNFAKLAKTLFKGHKCEKLCNQWGGPDALQKVWKEEERNA